MATQAIHTFQNAATATGNGTVLRTRGAGGVVVDVIISATATVVAEGRIADGATWRTLRMLAIATGTTATSATASGHFSVDTRGVDEVRFRISAYTSGTVSVVGNLLAEGDSLGSDIVTATISGTPAVTATISGTPNVAVTNTPAVTVSGTPTVSASITGTPNVSVTNTPAVTISGTPTVSASITGTPNVSVTNTPAVTISGTPAVTATISGTPSVSISGTPAVTATISGTPSVSVSGTATVSVSGTVTVDTELAAAAAIPTDDNETLASLTVPVVRALVAGKDASAGTKSSLLAVGGHPGDAAGNAVKNLYTIGYPQAWNGTNYDRYRNNIEVTLLANANRTTTYTSANQTNYNHTGLSVYMYIATAGTGALTLVLYAVDPQTASAVGVAQPADITTSGMKIFQFGPALTSSATRFSVLVPRTFILYVSHSDSSTWNYGIGYCLHL